jgi:hypothetical protein
MISDKGRELTVDDSQKEQYNSGASKDSVRECPPRKGAGDRIL